MSCFSHLGETIMAFELPKLPYEYNALEPYIDEKTMTIHHTKHHQGYVDKLNKAVENTDFENLDVNELMKKLDQVPEEVQTAVRNNGGGHANHSLFWNIMAPGGSEPSGNVANGINDAFGSFDKFKDEFTNAAMTRFGSGWAWLVVDNGRLAITSTANQDNPISVGKTPVLGVDVWEHAYYIKYQNKRNEYLENFWKVVNWKQVEENFAKAMNL